MEKTFLTLIFLFSFTLSAFAGHSSSTMRCLNGNDIIVVGDSVVELIECMGEPAYKNVKTVTTRTSKASKVENSVEEWFYNVNDWTHKITVKSGQVIGITDMGRK